MPPIWGYLFLALAWLASASPSHLPTEPAAGHGAESEAHSGHDLHTEGHEEEDHHESSAGKVAAVMLIGSITYGMILLYLTHNSSEYVRSCTWRMLSQTLSIFIAVLTYQAFDDLIEKELEHRPEHESDVSGGRKFVVFFLLPLVHLLGWYVLLQIYCYFSASYSQVLRTAGVSIGSHICAFAIMQAFGTLMKLYPFSLNLATAIGALLLSIAFLSLVFSISHVIRERYLQPHIKQELVSSWIEGATDGENDMLAIGIGFLLSQILRFAIHGELPPIDIVPIHHEWWEATLLLSCAIILICCTIVSSKLRIAAERAMKWRRLATAFQMLSVMTMAWVILFWGHWQLYDVHFKDEPLLGRIVLAVLLSILAIIVIFAMRKLMSLGNKDVTETLMTVLEGMALTIAFSWELAFERSVETVHPDEGFVSKHVFKFFGGMFIAAICLPGYVLFFLPMSLKAPESFKDSTDGAATSREQDEEKQDSTNSSDVKGVLPVENCSVDEKCQLSQNKLSDFLCKWFKLLL